MLSTEIHKPVLLDAVTRLLSPSLTEPKSIYLDMTLGMGGHARAILEANPQAQLIGIDRDTDALEIAMQNLAEFGERVELHHAVFDEIGELLAGRKISAALLDLGVSSLQLDSDARGFAYSRDTILDMRMDQSTGVSAAELLETSSVVQLRAIFEKYGEEKLSARYARAIKESPSSPKTTGELVQILQDATPAALKNHGHPAKRVFQALRIHLNQELQVLEQALPEVLNSLAINGRVVVLSYHSLEDKITKRIFDTALKSAAPAGLPVEPEHLAAKFVPVIRGSEKATEAEIAENPRAKSVLMRAVERVRY